MRRHYGSCPSQAVQSPRRQLRGLSGLTPSDIVKLGRTVGYLRAELFNDKGDLTATATSSVFFHPPDGLAHPNCASAPNLRSFSSQPRAPSSRVCWLHKQRKVQPF